MNFSVMLLALVVSLATLLSSASHADDSKAKTETAIFAGGCFWCMEPPFDKQEGVLSTISGYTGGHVVNPTYKAVTKAKTGHYEAIEIKYDSSKVTYEQLLEIFWRNIDPLDSTGQFCDKGPQYRSAIFYLNDAQKLAAQASIDALNRKGTLGSKIVTELLEGKPFYHAEKYHQDYYLKNPLRYKFYRTGCGRDKRLYEVWGENIE